MADTIRNELRKRFIANGGDPSNLPNDLTIRSMQKALYLQQEGLQENLTNDSQTIQGMIHAENNLAVNSISNVSVTPKDKDDTIYGYTVSDLQEDVVIKNGKVTGKLKYVTEGQLADHWGPGYFLAVDYSDENSTGATYKTGFYPSEGSGFVDLTVPDDGAGKITDKYNQKLYVFKTVNGVEHTQIFDLSGLVLEPAPTEE